MIPFSILDLAPIVEGGDAAQAFRNTLDLAQHAERWGYHRYWLAEHHNIPGIASAATSVVIGHVAGGTERIRVGAGGVMLPNHAPLVIAEQFGTLESLFPGRIDLGLGRAPGTDRQTANALRRNLESSAMRFPQDVLEIQSYFQPAEPDQKVRAIPGTGLKVPIWLLGSSTFSAQLAARLGLPFAFASHFAPFQLMQALHEYRHQFEPSDVLAEPHAMVAVNVFAADTDAEAQYQFTTLQQSFLNLRRGHPGPLPAPIPVEDMQSRMDPMDAMELDGMLRYSLVGSPNTVRRQVEAVLESTQADELMAVGSLYDHAARLRSFEILAGVREALAAKED